MEYDDELERMRRRRQRQREEQSRGPELNIMEFDDMEPARRRPQPRRRPKPDRRPEAREYRDDRGYDDRTHSRGGQRRRQPVQNHNSHDARARKKKKKHRFLFLKIILLLIIAGGLYFGYKYFNSGSGYWTIAVFGVDSRNGSLEQGALSDVEMLCVIDRKTGEIKLVSVYRDTYMEISPDGTYHKINEAYSKGGHQQAIEALERNLDLTIDDYATFNWKAVADAITILGGIDLEISDSEFRYINAFITETVESTGLGSHQLEHAGLNHLDGVQAVAYARLRLMDTDYNRTARQRLVIQLAMNKAKEADFKTLSIVAQTVIPQLSTSISLDDVISMARNIKNYHIGETGGFPFSRGEADIGKKDCVIPLTLESNVVQLHQFLYGTENYQPSSTVKQISARIASDSGMGEVAENAPEARVAGQKALEGGGENPTPSAGESPAPAGNPAGENGAAGDVQASAAETETETAATETTGDEAQTETSADETSQDTSEAEETDSESSASEIQGPGDVTETAAKEPSEENSPEEVPEVPGGPGQVPPGPGGPGSSGGQDQGDNVQNEKPIIETEEVGPGVS